MTPDFFRARLGEMVNPKDPLVILARQMPWDDIETYLARFFVRQPKPGQVVEVDDLFGGDRLAPHVLALELAVWVALAEMVVDRALELVKLDDKFLINW